MEKEVLLEGESFSTPLVSIVVPAYNVEKYIGKCIFSILQQSYENIELLVINDGSQDGTQEIIDSIIKDDIRASTFKIVNSGVSAARNLGVERSKGEYLIFVDGDDYISPEYIEYMLELVVDNNADFAFSKNCFSRKGESQVLVNEHCQVTPEKAISLLLSPDITVGCWNKIYKRVLITSNNIKFSTNLFYGEGLTFILQVAQKANSVVVGNKKVYHYRKNNEESATTKFDIKKIYNGERALLEIEQFLGKESKMVNSMFKYHLSLYRLAALVQLRVNKVEHTYKEDYRSWLSYIRKNLPEFVFSKQLSFYRKALIFGGSISPSLVAKLDRIRRRRIIKNSVDG